MTLKYVLLPYLFAAAIIIGIIALVIIVVCAIKDRKKVFPISVDVTSQFDNSVLISIDERMKTIADMLRTEFEPKPQVNHKADLCGVWTNIDDSMRYYITPRGGFYVLYIEDRYQPEIPGKTFVLRCSTSNPDDSNIFFADGDTLLTLAYSPEKDKIHLADSGEELERYEVRELAELRNLAPESVDFDINSFIDSTEK